MEGIPQVSNSTKCTRHANLTRKHTHAHTHTHTHTYTQREREREGDAHAKIEKKDIHANR